jgi:hypothetical protein
MSLNLERSSRVALPALALLSLMFLVGCGGGDSGLPIPPTQVDTSTAVTSLEGWQSLVDTTQVGIRVGALASFTDVFRDGLDISRRAKTQSARLAAEADWWASAETALVSIVGAEHVSEVLVWYGLRFGHRGGES